MSMSAQVRKWMSEQLHAQVDEHLCTCSSTSIQTRMAPHISHLRSDGWHFPKNVVYESLDSADICSTLFLHSLFNVSVSYINKSQGSITQPVQTTF